MTQDDSGQVWNGLDPQVWGELAYWRVIAPWGPEETEAARAMLDRARGLMVALDYGQGIGYAGAVDEWLSDLAIWHPADLPAALDLLDRAIPLLVDMADGTPILDRAAADLHDELAAAATHFNWWAEQGEDA